MVLTIVKYCLYGLCTLPNCCCQVQGICPKKEINNRIVEGSEKNRVGVCSVYTMRHCLQGPCQGPLHIPPKGNVTLYDQKAKKSR